MPIWKDETVAKKLDNLESTAKSLLRKLRLQTELRFQAARVEAAARGIRGRTLCAGEQWFQEKWHHLGMYEDTDLFNVASGPYVPDLINHKYKYTIEIESKVHNTQNYLLRDIKKAIYFKKKGYSIFFIRDFDETKLRQVVGKIKKIRNRSIPKEKKKFKSERFNFLNKP